LIESADGGVGYGMQVMVVEYGRIMDVKVNYLPRGYCSEEIS
jgi:hypothetical protein